MSFMALLWAVAAAWALVSGKAIWLQRTVTRAGEPVQYWSSVLICVLFAFIFLSLGPVR
jgi:hypothetical protein